MFKRAIKVLVITLVLILGTSVVVTASPSFSDVRPGDWHYNTIMEMARQGVTSGFPDGTFRPNAPMTRIEFYTLITNMTVPDENRQIIVNDTGQIIFDGGAHVRAGGRLFVLNLVQNFWGNETIILVNYARSLDLDIMRLIGHGEAGRMYYFEPDLGMEIPFPFGPQVSVEHWTLPITRAEIIRTINNILSFQARPPQFEFETLMFDLNVEHENLPWYIGVETLINDFNRETTQFSAVALFQAGIITGDADGNINLSNTATRAEVMTILNRTFNPETRVNVTIPTINWPRADGIPYNLNDPHRGPALVGMVVNGITLEMGRDGRPGTDQGFTSEQLDAGRVGLNQQGFIFSGGYLREHLPRARTVGDVETHANALFRR